MNPAQIPTSLVVGILAAGATTAGGALALRFQSVLGALFGFSSGAVIGVALLDLLPEALTLAGPTRAPLAIMTAVAGGFIGYLLLDRVSASLFDRHRGHLGPGSLTLHSLMDGLGIGLAFQVSSAAGLVVALAVLAHDFIDGANTVALTLAGGGTGPVARRWLVADAAAPLFGIAIAGTMAIADSLLAVLLAIFAGGFLYIGASELLPRSREGTGALLTAGATCLGLGFIYGVVCLSLG